MRILVTGARGFIGRHVLKRLEANPHAAEIHATQSVDRPASPSSRTKWHTVDLIRPGAARSLCAAVRPTHILHAAWITAHNEYWGSPENLEWLAASCELLREFMSVGGQRFVQIGTAAEYDWSFGCMVENITPEKPHTLYGTAKKSFHDALQATASAGGLSAATGRVFFGYGPHENAGRLIPYACRQLSRGQPAEFSSGKIWRDFLYIEDIAAAAETLLSSPVTGPVNLASGEPVQLSRILKLLGSISGRPDLVRLGARPDRPDDPPMMLGDSTRLRSTGWQPTYNLQQGLELSYEWWKSQGS
jgi:nucleoside-diphosphate-sugar epimerase